MHILHYLFVCMAFVPLVVHTFSMLAAQDFEHLFHIQLLLYLILEFHLVSSVDTLPSVMRHEVCLTVQMKWNLKKKSVFLVCCIAKGLFRILVAATKNSRITRLCPRFCGFSYTAVFKILMFWRFYFLWFKAENQRNI